MPFLAASGFTNDQSDPSPGRVGGSWTVLTRKARAKAPTESIPGQQTSWTQVPGASLKDKAGASRPCFLAPHLPKSHQRSGTKRGPAGPPRGESLTYSFNHHFLSTCCVPGFEPGVKETKMDRAAPDWDGSQRHSIGHKTAAKRKKVLRVDKHRGERGRERRGYGESLPLTFTLNVLPPSGNLASRWGGPTTPRKS